MAATIRYDRPVTNLIDGLNATGHVTHRTDKKTMVTLHHNGGVNFSHQDILDIWKKRPASAHFDVDRNGAVCQYVRELEYAWACASSEGNRNSISIEMANSSGNPDWLVSDTTWKSAARLAGWLFANVIKARPSKANLVYHHHWYATACAGPYMDRIYPQVLAATQAAYDYFTGKTPTAAEDWFDMATKQDLRDVIMEPDFLREVARYVLTGIAFGPDGQQKVLSSWVTQNDALTRLAIQAASDDLTPEQVQAAVSSAIASGAQVTGELKVVQKPVQ